MVNFWRVPVRISFKRETMDPHKMEVGDSFSWDRPLGRSSVPTDITPIHFECMTRAEEKRLIRLVEEGTSCDDNE